MVATGECRLEAASCPWSEELRASAWCASRACGEPGAASSLGAAAPARASRGGGDCPAAAVAASVARGAAGAAAVAQVAASAHTSRGRELSSRLVHSAPGSFSKAVPIVSYRMGKASASEARTPRRRRGRRWAARARRASRARRAARASPSSRANWIERRGSRDSQLDRQSALDRARRADFALTRVIANARRGSARRCFYGRAEHKTRRPMSCSGEAVICSILSADSHCHDSAFWLKNKQLLFAPCRNNSSTTLRLALRLLYW